MANNNDGFTAGKKVEVLKMIGYWRNKEAAAYAARLSVVLGDPDHDYYSEHCVKWANLSGIREIEIKDESVPYDIPSPHRIFVEVTHGLRVDPEFVGQIAAVTGAIVVDGLEGVVCARSSTLTKAVAMIGWVEDLTRGLASPEDFASRIDGNVTPSWYSTALRENDVPFEKAEARGTDVGDIEDVGEEEKVNTTKMVPGEIYDISVTFPITKVNDEERLVTGIVLEPDEIDSQNDTISEGAIKSAAHNFVAKYNQTTRMGVMHSVFGKIGVELAESWITREDGMLGEEAVKKGSWVMTVKVTDDNLWQKIKSGAITGFSIGGVATVT